MTAGQSIKRLNKRICFWNLNGSNLSSTKISVRFRSILPNLIGIYGCFERGVEHVYNFQLNRSFHQKFNHRIKLKLMNGPLQRSIWCMETPLRVIIDIFDLFQQDSMNIHPWVLHGCEQFARLQKNLDKFILNIGNSRLIAKLSVFFFHEIVIFS